VALAVLACVASLCVAQTQGPLRITLDEAIQLALQHNHNLLAARTTIQQSQAAETTANLRPNPSLFATWAYLPLFSPSNHNADYLQNSTEGDLGISYLIERGKKRQHRLQAARDLTAQTRSLVADNERSLTFTVASLFVNVQLAESTLELAEQDLKSFQQTVDLGEIRYKAGAISEDDSLKIKLQRCSSKLTCSRHSWLEFRRFPTCGSRSDTNPFPPTTMSPDLLITSRCRATSKTSSSRLCRTGPICGRPSKV
jgi:hypothetical protein